MSLAFDVFNMVLLSMLLGVFGTWVYLLSYIVRSFTKAPRLNGEAINEYPKVSVIVPARNEEPFINRCLESLEAQDYPNYDIITIDDSSADRTGEIMKKHASIDRKVIFVEAGPKPDGWAGKNWACYQGYLRSDGDMLLFTDADTTYSPSIISSAVSKMLREGLDALTLIPRLICLDAWTRITLPFLSTFLHSRYSPLRVNDPKHKIGYFFGSFYLIRRNVYQSIGTHSEVRNELVEDGALGSLVKKMGHKMKMFRGEHMISAIWARDFSSLWNGLGRLIIPLYRLNRFQAVSVFLLTFFLFLFPFLTLSYSSFFLSNVIAYTLFLFSSATVSMIVMAGVIEARAALRLNVLYAFAAPLSAAIIAFGFLSGIVKARTKKSVKWRDRDYVYSKYSSEGFTL